MKTNDELQKDVQDAIKREPLLKAAEIGVTAKDGVVTLLGSLDICDKKSEAKGAAKRVTGVKTAALKIDMKVLISQQTKQVDDFFLKAAALFRKMN